MRPGVVSIDCDQCHQFMYDLETGKPEEWRGKPARRVKGVPPPCKTKCPKRGPDEYTTLLPQNLECLEHYSECSATGDFPDDPLVRRHAAILKNVERHVEQARSDRNLQMMALNVAASKAMQLTQSTKG